MQMTYGYSTGCLISAQTLAFPNSLIRQIVKLRMKGLMPLMSLPQKGMLREGRCMSFRFHEQAWWEPKPITIEDDGSGYEGVEWRFPDDMPIYAKPIFGSPDECVRWLEERPKSSQRIRHDLAPGALVELHKGLVPEIKTPQAVLDKVRAEGSKIVFDTCHLRSDDRFQTDLLLPLKPSNVDLIGAVHVQPSRSTDEYTNFMAAKETQLESMLRVLRKTGWTGPVVIEMTPLYHNSGLLDLVTRSCFPHLMRRSLVQFHHRVTKILG